MVGFIGGMVQRCRQALAVGVCCGFLGVLIDGDHIICAILRGERLIETHGCRLLHPYLLSASGFIAGVAVALGIGLLFAVVQHAAGTAT